MKTSSHDPGGGAAGRDGFTLVEALISVAIIAALLGILLPALGQARSAAGRVKSLANLRSLGMTFSIYAQQRDGKFPWLAPGEPVFSTPPSEDQHQYAFEPIWMLEGLWPVLMHDVAPWPEHFESWLSPGHRRKPPYWPIPIGTYSHPVSYVYANSFLGAPVIWNGRGDATQRDVRPVRVSEVEHPSAKVLLYDADRFYLRRDATRKDRRPVLFVDGSASARLDEKATAPVRNPLNPLYNAPRIYHDTPNGVRGWDF